MGTNPDVVRVSKRDELGRSAERKRIPAARRRSCIFPRIHDMQPHFAHPHVPPTSGRLHNVHPDGDEAIRQTDSDAALARFSAVQKGYISDLFVRHLLPRGAHLQPSRPPLINVGTYVRSEGIDQLVNKWFELAAKEGRQCQIVSLGAGSDTRFWRIAVRGLCPSKARSCGLFADIPETGWTTCCHTGDLR